ncbi:uncharacterized protein SAPINGB_P001904 [Magnusiomyces paraingens]|uniref:Pre-rRNA-processing protein RIX1 n=1 Tax=Magnusiomyces paraingens TaxID=2606893 RepID=A0A5E8BBS0_9ASCO|nr:uncharacterized protein SAPINGB_P001904 [Saprochaete ingens]VVT48692.1 unnamed protein product [Saprochaete ingens]
MATLQSLLATALAPSQEGAIASNAMHTLSLLQSGAVLAQADENTLHKFMVRVSALLKAKAPIAKWFAAYLAHTACETNWKVLKSHGGTWAGLLLHLLEINEQPVVKEAAIRALRTIFAKTHGKQEFTRDITTPRLPQYLKLLFKHAQISEETVSVNQNGASSKKNNDAPADEFIELGYDEHSSDEENDKEDNEQNFFHDTTKVETDIKDMTRLLPAIIPAINTVLKLQSTTFRPFTKRYLALISTLISISYTDPTSISPALLRDVCTGYALLHHSAPKDTEALTWRLSIKHVVGQINTTITDISFAFVDEDFNGKIETGSLQANFTADNGKTITVDTPVLKLKPLSGTTNGIPSAQTLTQASDKIKSLMNLLAAHLRVSTKSPVKLPIGALITLADRILSFSAYTTTKTVGGVNEGPRRAAFLNFISEIQFFVFDLLLLRLIPLAQTMLLCHVDTLTHHVNIHVQPPAGPAIDNIISNRRLQLKALQFATSLLRLQGSIPKTGAPAVAAMVSAAVALSSPYKDPSAEGLADAVPAPHLFFIDPTPAQLAIVARFFETVVSTVPDLSLPSRASIDRWFIVSAATAKNRTYGVTSTNTVVTNKQIQLWDNVLSTSAAFPGRASKYSILPMAARLAPGSRVLDALIKPRLPPSVNVVQRIIPTASFQPTTSDEVIQETDSQSKKRKIDETDKQDALFSSKAQSTVDIEMEYNEGGFFKETNEEKVNAPNREVSVELTEESVVVQPPRNVRESIFAKTNSEPSAEVDSDASSTSRVRRRTKKQMTEHMRQKQLKEATATPSEDLEETDQVVSVGPEIVQISDDSEDDNDDDDKSPSTADTSSNNGQDRSGRNFRSSTRNNRKENTSVEVNLTDDKDGEDFEEDDDEAEEDDEVIKINNISLDLDSSSDEES